MLPKAREGARRDKKEGEAERREEGTEKDLGARRERMSKFEDGWMDRQVHR